jgi:hypothetical protein
LRLDKYEHLPINEILRLLRKDILGITLREVSAHLQKSVSFVHQTESGTRIYKSDGLLKFIELFPESDQKAIYELLVRKTVIKKSEGYGNILKDKGVFLQEKYLDMVRKDFKKSTANFKSLGLFLDMNGPQVKRLLMGELALNRKQLISLAQGIGVDPERYLFAGGHISEAMDDFIYKLPDLFLVIEKYKNGDADEKKRITDIISETLKSI